MKQEKLYHFQCTKCGKCCSDEKTIVNLTYTDILRIQWEKDYSLDEFLEMVGFYKFEEELTEEQLEKMVVPPIQTQNGPAFLGLRKDESGKCVFLKKNYQCRLYNARPSICRTFPFHFHTKADKNTNNQLNMSMNYTEKALSYCPGINTNTPEIDANYWLHEGSNAVKEILSETILIRKWNTNVKEGKISPSAENYLRIILNQIADVKEKNKIIKNTSSSIKKKNYKEVAKSKILEKKD